MPLSQLQASWQQHLMTKSTQRLYNIFTASFSLFFDAATENESEMKTKDAKAKARGFNLCAKKREGHVVGVGWTLQIELRVQTVFGFRPTKHIHTHTHAHTQSNSSTVKPLLATLMSLAYFHFRLVSFRYHFFCCFLFLAR